MSLVVFRVPLAAIAAGVVSLLAATLALAQTGPAVYVDAATGVSFRAPAGLYVVPARPGVGGRTTQAVFATYANPIDPQTRVDLTRELVITAYVANKMPDESLRVWAARNIPGRIMSVSDLPSGRGILVQGLFKAGPRKYALIAREPDRVLIVDAFPTFSSKTGIFDGVLASLEVK